MTKRYFTGVPCKRGHIAERQTRNGDCIECKRLRDKNDYIKHRARRLNNAKQWRKNNPLKRRLYGQVYADRYPEKLRQNTARWVKRNQEKVAIAAARWKNRHPEKVKEWRIRNVDKLRVYTRNRRAKISSAYGEHSSEDIKEIYTAQKARCAYCRESLAQNNTPHVDHIVPIKRGGENSRRNLQILCKTCNLRKNAKDPIEYAQSLGWLL